ncbi:type I DNA topoisomerase [Geomonas sp. Red32]|uniref:type I DNA topoisomerase n=1 Tax=Geomonas sp. Red32 TaxID=2912856 RepID=UPI00202CEB60|nr:type I DNA topoisomerase [Geomonas sp. Red32]MCM0082395.1 type I DNA topoisomerase [Geomonas sp. Red32]
MLIIVESPTKAKKIQSILKTKTISTVGHFKDLPDASMGVDLATYQPTFILHEKKKNLPKELKAAAKGETVMLAGDPDREGYAISRHIFEEVKGVAKECLRMEIFEVTEKGLKDSLSRAVPFEKTNAGLYHAFLGRRVGDRLVGYILSPLASRDLAGKFSVGRVQSPAVRLVVDREREIRAFVPAPYWILAIVLEKGGIEFLARHLRGKFERKEEAEAIVAAIQGAKEALAEKVEKKETRQSPKPPFTTVDLQAAAAARLKLSPEQTMKLAQALFDHGLITYHRTDSVRMADEFVAEIRTFLSASLGERYVPPKPHQYKSKNSQADAHEGIRPTHLHELSGINALMGREGLTAEHARLYELIFRRAVASQMAQAVYDSTVMLFEAAGERFRASGRVLKFDGFLRIYTDQEEDKEGKEDDPVQALPEVVRGEMVPKKGEKLDEKKTKPPGRFTFGSLVKELERLEIGRPSTYAAITRNIAERGYVREEKGKVVPLPPGEALVDYLRTKHGWVIDYDLTRRMEGFLDLVVDNKESWQRFCKGVHAKMGYAVPPSRGDGNAPSEGQLRYAKALAERARVEIPASVLASRQEISKWIDGAKKKGTK